MDLGTRLAVYKCQIGEVWCDEHAFKDKKLFDEVAMSMVGILATWVIGVLTGSLLVMGRFMRLAIMNQTNSPRSIPSRMCVISLISL